MVTWRSGFAFLNSLQSVHDALGALLGPVLARRAHAYQDANRPLLREERRQTLAERRRRPG